MTSSNITNSITPTLSTLRKRLYELDAKRSQGKCEAESLKLGGLYLHVGSSLYQFCDNLNDYRPNAQMRYTADCEYVAAMPDAIHLIREQHRLLMEAKEVIDECHDQLWHLAKKPESSVLVQKAKAFLCQLEESV